MRVGVSTDAEMYRMNWFAGTAFGIKTEAGRSINQQMQQGCGSCRVSIYAVVAIIVTAPLAFSITQLNLIGFRVTRTLIFGV